MRAGCKHFFTVRIGGDARARVYRISPAPRGIRAMPKCTSLAALSMNEHIDLGELGIGALATAPGGS
jgi:hypothetical protein